MYKTLIGFALVIFVVFVFAASISVVTEDYRPKVHDISYCQEEDDKGCLWRDPDTGDLYYNP